MPVPQFDPTTSEALHFLFLWSGYGSLVGLTAKAIMPGRDGGGALATWALGLGGGLVGNVFLALLTDASFDLMTPYGIVAAVAGSFGLLLVYRLSDGKFWDEEPARAKPREIDPDAIADTPRPKRLRRRKAWFSEQRDATESARKLLNEDPHSTPETIRIERLSRQLLNQKQRPSSKSQDRDAA